MEETLFDKLGKYGKSGMYPMHMPGHKRNSERFFLENPYEMDITEIDGFDNLHHAQEILKESMEMAANVFRAHHTFYLVNGSTAGILIGIFAATKQGDTVLVARNCHRAVYHAMELRGLTPVYLLPEQTETEEQQEIGIAGEISSQTVRAALAEHPETTLVVLTSPTYEGVLSDIKGIVKEVHAAGARLLVDEAHGAHLGFHSIFYENSNVLGADLVVQSVHKTLPAFTQTALLHVNENGTLYDRVAEYSAIFQTSSPSYLLMASIDYCVHFVSSPEGAQAFCDYAEQLHQFYEAAQGLKNLYLWRPNGKERVDPSKIVIVPRKKMTGKQLYDILKDDYRIQPEMAAGRYVLCMTSVCDTREGFQRLRAALFEIDQRMELMGDTEGGRSSFSTAACEDFEDGEQITFAQELPRQVYAMSEARCLPKKSVALKYAVGEIAAQEVIIYPPGIPTLVPGEQIGKKEVARLHKAILQGLTVYGVDEQNFVKVIAQKPEQQDR